MLSTFFEVLSGLVWMHEQQYFVEVQYCDDPVPQVLALDSPTYEDLITKIDETNDSFSDQKLELFHKTGSTLKNVTGAPGYVSLLIQNSKVRDMVVFLIKTKATPAVKRVACTATTQAPKFILQTKSFDGFLSYQWDSQATVKLIHQDLQDKYGLAIWMDLKDMTGCTSSAMAEGIDSSHVFVPVLTLKYQQSENCLLEIRYAKERKKPKVPIRLLQKGEDAKGDAFAITAGLMYADFAGKQHGTPEWDKEIQALAREIKQRLSQQNHVPASVTPPSQVAVDPLRAWLNPVDSSSDLEKHSKAFIRGTRQYYLKSINAWLAATNQFSKILWLNGGAGLGKSVIAWLVTQNLPSDFILGSAFFCQHNDMLKNNPERLVATIIWNLSTVLPSFKTFSESVQVQDELSVKNGKSSILKDPHECFQKIIIEGMKHLDADDCKKNILLVIDALDECGAPFSNARRQLLELLCQKAASLPPFVRIFTTGRPERDIFDSLRRLDSMVLTPNYVENRKDMTLLVTDMLRRKFLPSELGPDDLQFVCDKIFEKSAGVFQFARLACSQLMAIPADQVVAQIDSLGSGMDGVYEQYLRMSSVNTNSFQLVMKVVLAAKEPLTQDAIAELLEAPSFLVGQVLLEIHRIVDTSDSGRVKLIHKSLSDHLISHQRCVDPRFFVDIVEAKRHIALACLRIMLNYCDSVENRYEALNGTSRFIAGNPTAQYAFKFWLIHFEEAGHDLLFQWVEWKKFLAEEKFGPAALCIGIMQEKDWLVHLVLRDGNARKLVTRAKGIKVFSSTPLYEAAKRGLTLACSALIESGGEDVNSRGYSWGGRNQFGEGNKTALMAAAKGGHYKTVRLLLEKGADRAIVDANGEKAQGHSCTVEIIQWTGNNDDPGHPQNERDPQKLNSQNNFDSNNEAQTGGLENLEAVKQVVLQGTKVDSVNFTKSALLQIAALNGHLEAVKWLTQQGGNIVNSADEDKLTPLHVASRNGHVEIVKWLTQQGAAVNSESKRKTTPLHFASKNGHVNVVKWLLQERANVNAKTQHKWTALHYSSLHGHLDVAKLLAEKAADLEAEDESKWTPLHIASLAGHLEIVKWLAQQGAYVNAHNNSGLTPFHIASQNGQVEVVKWLAHQGALLSAEDENKWTPLHLASQNGHWEVVKWLVNYGANVNAENRNQSTALHIASQNGHLEVVKLLMQGGANVDALNSSKSTALHNASRNGHLEVVKWLAQQGSIVNVRDNKNATPLHGAVQKGHVEVVKWLLYYGANTNIKNNDMATPLDIAAELGQLEVVKLLVQQGDDTDAESIATALQIASQNVHWEVVKWLAEQAPVLPPRHARRWNKISCDGCFQYAFRGLRFRCLVCPNYDLCAVCFQSVNSVHAGAHSEGKSSLSESFERMVHPVDEVEEMRLLQK